ncbi:lutropin subunit beta-like isoform X1 [Podarcis raffonei]|uniref:lutropin subunit beta-like isoform X1 n=2 Tax=Podarcis raffonei TaxID=65483 RepID=UPI002329439E|nr:lutropin subunit beta-like isoform X1 [Podarcis raffonei]
MKLIQGKILLLAAFFLLVATPTASRRSNMGIASNTPACRPINVTIAAEKEDCLICMPITTTICSGYCETREMLLKDERIVFNQRVCTYREVRYETTLLRGCPAGVDPIFTYPVAVSCHCDLCKVASSDCTVQGTGPNSCSNPNPFI